MYYVELIRVLYHIESAFSNRKSTWKCLKCLFFIGNRCLTSNDKMAHHTTVIFVLL